MNQIKRKYRKPAVQEAIVEAKFLYDSFDTTLPGQVYERIKGTYPKKKNLELITLVLGSGDTSAKSPLPPQAPVMQAWKNDESELLQVGPGIAVANRIKYTSWDDFVPGIRAVLSAYIESVEPKLLTRIGTRYINRFLIPQENVILAEYFKIGIGIPSTFNNLQGFDLTFVHRVRNASSPIEFEIRTKFVTDTIRAGEIGTSFLLDIDCYCNAEIVPDVDKILSLSTEAHRVLEDVFESLLTDRTRQLMEEEK